MSEEFSQLLAATIDHLENLKAHGTSFVTVTPEIFSALNQPAPRRVTPVQATEKKNEAKMVEDKIPPPYLVEKPVSPQKTPMMVSANQAEKIAEMELLRERAMVCIKCPHLAATRKNVVFGVGNVDSPLMFVGEAPGADEDEQGEPFVGKAGELLTRIIQTMGFSRETVYIANVLKCRPDTPNQAYGNRKPTTDEMKTCLPYLLEQIDIIKPRVIVALGATAVEGLFGKPMPITKLRGNWQTFRDTPVMPTFHPAYLLRNQALTEKRKVWEDMLQVLEKLAAPISEKQRGYFLKA
ncbi:MAG: uracil-DNA glycosylase [Verrucomicrobiota bacterium]